MSVFKNQTLTIRITVYELINDVKTPVDLTGATVVIKYLTGELKQGQASANLIDAVNGVVESKLSAGTLKEIKNWRFWPHVTMSNGDIFPGTNNEVEVFREGDQ